MKKSVSKKFKNAIDVLKQWTEGLEDAYDAALNDDVDMIQSAMDEFSFDDLREAVEDAFDALTEAGWTGPRKKPGRKKAKKSDD